MCIEKNLFQKSRCDFAKQTPFGFVKADNGYSYKTHIMRGEFRAEVFISDNGEVSGKLYDTAYDDEYTNFRMEYAVMLVLFTLSMAALVFPGVFLHIRQ